MKKKQLLMLLTTLSMGLNSWGKGNVNTNNSSINNNAGAKTAAENKVLETQATGTKSSPTGLAVGAQKGSSAASNFSKILEEKGENEAFFSFNDLLTDAVKKHSAEGNSFLNTPTNATAENLNLRILAAWNTVGKGQMYPSSIEDVLSNDWSLEQKRNLLEMLVKVQNLVAQGFSEEDAFKQALGEEKYADFIKLCKKRLAG